MGFPTSRDVVEGWVFPTSIIIITICFPAPWRKCNATGAEDDDDDEDVGGVDGDDGGMIYYYYCDYYSRSVLDCFFNSTIFDHRDTGTESRENTLRSSKARPSRGPRGRRGACGSCNR